MSFVEKALRKIQANTQTAQLAGLDQPLMLGHIAPDTRHETTGPQPEREAVPRASNRMVHMDREALRRSGLLPPEEQEHELADQYRAIKRPLIESAFARRGADVAAGQLIMTASALPGDGKTFTCINLAISMSLEKDHTVLLVDGDVAKPHITGVFGLDREPGLLDVLADPSLDLESVILPTDVPRLSLLPAGHRSDTATELLASDRMAHIARSLAALNPRGIVLFDSPPILLTSEAQVLSGLVDQIVLVVKAGVTPQQAVKDAIDTMGPEKNIRLVLNQAELSGPMGYYYGYRYGYNRSTQVQQPAVQTD